MVTIVTSMVPSPSQLTGISQSVVLVKGRAQLFADNTYESNGAAAPRRQGGTAMSDGRGIGIAASVPTESGQ